MPAALAQLINGVGFDFSSIKITLATPVPTFITRIASISYEHSLTPGVLRGTSSHKLARSRGTYEASGSMSIYLDEWRIMRRALVAAPPASGGFMEKPFQIVCSMAEALSPPSTDKLTGCRITRVGRQYQQGGEFLMIDIDFDVMKLVEGGDAAVRDKSGI